MGFSPTIHQQLFINSNTFLVDAFDPLLDIEIKQLLKRFTNALCKADSMATWFTKDCQHVLIDPIA